MFAPITLHKRRRVYPSDLNSPEVSFAETGRVRTQVLVRFPQFRYYSHRAVHFTIGKRCATLRELFSSNSPNDKLHQFLWGSCAYCDLRKLRPLTLVVDSPD